MRFFALTTLLAALAPVVALSQGQGSLSSRDEISLRVLRAVDYAEIQRVVLTNDCQRKPGLAASLPACSKIGVVPPTTIELTVLPHFNRYVSNADAMAALAFWTSPDGARISKKLVREITENNPTILTRDELQLLDRFNKSEAGIAMSRLAQDRSVSVAVIRAIGAYVP